MALDNAYPTAASTLSTMAQWESFFVGLGGATGVISGLGGELVPSINSGARTVSITTGAALVRGFYTNNAATTTLNVPAQSAGNRVDRLVLRLDRTAVTAAGWITPVIIQGTSGSPTPPAVQATTGNSWDLLVCRWTTNSNGTLSGLVDERYLLGGGISVFRSTVRPPAAPARVGIETDTRKLLWSDGASWVDVFDDSGWINVNATGHWQNGGFIPRIRRIGSVVYLKGQLSRTTLTLQSDTTGSSDSPCLNVPAGFAPAESHNWAGWSNGPAQALRMWLDTSGVLHVTQHSLDIPVGGTLYIDTTYMIG